MAHINKRRTKGGEWRYEVRYRAPDGKEHSKTCRTRRDAERFEAQTRVDVARGQWVDPRAGKVTIDDYSAQWLATRHSLKPRTRETYEDQLRLHIKPELGDVELSKLTPKAVRTWHAELLARGLSHNTAAKCYRLLRTILGTAVEDELILRNPCALKGAGVERVEERPVATVEQVWSAADAMPDRHRCLILVAGFTGLRLGELLGLECRHVNLLQRTLRVEQQEQQLRGGVLVITRPKTVAGIRTLALPPLLVTELEQHLAGFCAGGPEDRLFPGDKGGPLRRQVLQGYWNDARAAAGLPKGFRFHDLRHTANKLTAATGASTAELMRRLGHASPAAALRYQHATEDRDRTIADLLGAHIEAAGRAPERDLRAIR